jgi:hypothetical protein
VSARKQILFTVPLLAVKYKVWIPLSPALKISFSVKLTKNGMFSSKPIPAQMH